MTINVVSGPDSSVCAARSVSPWNGADVEEHRIPEAINSEQLRRQCVGNMSFAMSLLSMFEENSESRHATFDRALMEYRNDVIACEAHALKGVAGILAANRLKDVCVELESAAEVADWSCIQNLIETLHHEIKRVINCIPDIRTLGLSKS